MEAAYNEAAVGSVQRQLIRNEYIGEAMQAIDAQYTTYELGLTRDRQLVGFGAQATALSLGTAGQLTTGGTAKVLSQLGLLSTGLEGKYESEVILAKTVDIIEGQMRASRGELAKAIIDKMKRTDAEYPLGIAKSDLEDYYRAGTLNTGLQKAATEAGKTANTAEADKATATVTLSYETDDNEDLLRAYIVADGLAGAPARVAQLGAALKNVKPPCKYDVEHLFNNADAASCRAALVTEARKEGLKF